MGETRGEKRLRVANARLLRSARAVASRLRRVWDGVVRQHVIMSDATESELDELRMAGIERARAALDVAKEKRTATRAKRRK